MARYSLPVLTTVTTIWLAPSTTWLLVRISPVSVSTMPVPAATPPETRLSMSTTPGTTAAVTADQSGAAWDGLELPLPDPAFGEGRSPPLDSERVPSVEGVGEAVIEEDCRRSRAPAPMNAEAISATRTRAASSTRLWRCPGEGAGAGDGPRPAAGAPQVVGGIGGATGGPCSIGRVMPGSVTS